MTPEMIAFQICVQARQPVHLWGEPGIGKTKQTEALAKSLEEALWPLILSIREPSDQGGLPILVRHDDGTQSVWMAPPRWAKELSDGDGGIVHLDELNVSPPVVQNSALRVVQEGWAGDQKLPDATSFIVCGNPAETNPGVYDLTPAMANRLVHISWPLDHDGWCAGMLTGWKPPKIVRLPSTWERLVPEVNATFVALISAHGTLLHQKPDDPVEAGKAWPSPRTWTTAARIAAAAQAAGHDLKSIVSRILVEGCVGRAAATEFGSYIANLDLRDPEEYMKDPLGTPFPKRQDQIMATLSRLAAVALKDHPDHVQRYYNAWKVMGRLKGKPDVGLLAARALLVSMPDEVMDTLPPELTIFGPLIKLSGIDFSPGAKS